MDVLGLLVWLSGAGISAVSAFVLERVSGFGQLSPNGKQTVATIVAVLIAITAISILVQQIAHGVQRSVTGGSNG